jgi:hypothetical protein
MPPRQPYELTQPNSAEAYEVRCGMTEADRLESGRWQAANKRRFSQTAMNAQLKFADERDDVGVRQCYPIRVTTGGRS